MLTIKSLTGHLTSIRTKPFIGKAFRLVVLLAIAACVVICFAPQPKHYFIELSPRNFYDEITVAGTLPALLETCVPEACKIEEPELDRLAQSLQGQVRVIRLNQTAQPMIFSGLLRSLANASRNPFLPVELGGTSARWIMHTMLTPRGEPMVSFYGLLTTAAMHRLVVSQMVNEGEANPDDPLQQPGSL